MRTDTVAAVAVAVEVAVAWVVAEVAVIPPRQGHRPSSSSPASHPPAFASASPSPRCCSRVPLADGPDPHRAPQQLEAAPPRKQQAEEAGRGAAVPPQPPPLWKEEDQRCQERHACTGGPRAAECESEGKGSGTAGVPAGKGIAAAAEVHRGVTSVDCSGVIWAAASPIRQVAGVDGSLPSGPYGLPAGVRRSPASPLRQRQPVQRALQRVRPGPGEVHARSDGWAQQLLNVQPRPQRTRPLPAAVQIRRMYRSEPRPPDPRCCRPPSSPP